MTRDNASIENTALKPGMNGISSSGKILMGIYLECKLLILFYLDQTRKVVARIRLQSWLRVTMSPLILYRARP
jgi:hypothetical protein